MKTCVVKNCLFSPCPGPDTCKFRQEPLGVSPERQKELSEDCDKGTIHPFYCGTQSIDWRISNCDKCTKGIDNPKPGEFLCEIDYCISYACIADGTISEAMAKRMGYAREHYGWKCPERRIKI